MDAIEHVEIVADEQGIHDLIQYLLSIKNDKDHMHLIIDSEINSFPISGLRKGKTFFAKHVRLEFAATEAWEKI